MNAVINAPRPAVSAAPASIDPAEDDYLDDEEVCPNCHGDGRDPMNDYFLPCPLCQGEQS